MNLFTTRDGGGDVGLVIIAGLFRPMSHELLLLLLLGEPITPITSQDERKQITRTLCRS